MVSVTFVDQLPHTANRETIFTEKVVTDTDGGPRLDTTTMEPGLKHGVPVVTDSSNHPGIPIVRIPD